MNDDFAFNYEKQQELDYQNQIMREYNYSHTKKNPKALTLSFIKENLQYRISKALKDYALPGIEYKNYPNLKEAYKRAAEKNHYELQEWFYINFKEEWLYLKKSDFLYDGKGNKVLETIIENIYIPFADKITKFENAKNKQNIVNKTINEPIPSNDIEIENIDTIEHKKEEIKIEQENEIIEENIKIVKLPGRPLGSKNKKPEKEIFMPTYKLTLIDGNVDVNSVIMSIADLVWRNPNQRDFFYINKLDLSNLTNDQIKFVRSLFYMNQNKTNISNNYFYVEKDGKNNILKPYGKRKGYYYIDKKNGKPNLVSLSIISNKLKLAKNTVIYKLTKMTLQELVKKS